MFWSRKGEFETRCLRIESSNMKFAPRRVVMTVGMMPGAARWELGVRLIIAAQSRIDHVGRGEGTAGYQGLLRGEQL